MKVDCNSVFCEGAMTLWRDYGGNILPWEFTGPEDEFMATRTTASLGVFLTSTPIFDISGKDAVKFLNSVCVNRDFGKMKIGASRHALLCNDKGQILQNGVVLKTTEDSFRTYWMAPIIHYHLMNSGMEVEGVYRDDEYFFQIDGPKSLEILEKAAQADLHDLKFAQQKKVKICGTDMVVFRLGMTGALAYEVHGHANDAETVYKHIREVLFEFGGKLQGARNYPIIQHTPGGYPNQMQHFWYPYNTSGEGIKEFCKDFSGFTQYSGSASDDEENFFVTPYDIGWGNLVNFEHGDFIGKDALMEASKDQRKTMVTLEWNADDVGDVFSSQFRGTDVKPYDQIEHTTTIADASLGNKIRGDYVVVDGKKIGVSTGKTYSFYERHMISLCCIDKEFAVEGKDVIILWGTPGNPVKEIRAKVARFPYFNGEFRNETFDVEKIPHPQF